MYLLVKHGQNRYTCNMDELQTYRNEVDEIDKKILSLLAKRNILVKKIAIGKRKQHLPIIDKQREEGKIAEILKEAKKQGIEKEFVQTVWDAIFKASYMLQNKNS